MTYTSRTYVESETLPLVSESQLVVTIVLQ